MCQKDKFPCCLILPFPINSPDEATEMESLKTGSPLKAGFHGNGIPVTYQTRKMNVHSAVCSTMLTSV